jgi:hypothetical protein
MRESSKDVSAGTDTRKPRAKFGTTRACPQGSTPTHMTSQMLAHTGVHSPTRAAPAGSHSPGLSVRNKHSPTILLPFSSCLYLTPLPISTSISHATPRTQLLLQRTMGMRCSRGWALPRGEWQRDSSQYSIMTGKFTLRRVFHKAREREWSTPLLLCVEGIAPAFELAPFFELAACLVCF